MNKVRLIITIYGVSFLLIFLSLGFKLENELCGEIFFGTGISLLFVMSVYNIRTGFLLSSDS